MARWALPWVILPSMRFFPLFLFLSLSVFAQDEPPAVATGRGRPRRAGSNEPINEAPSPCSARARSAPPSSPDGSPRSPSSPTISNHYLIAVASGNIWLTTNNGTTWTPVFDNYGSYSIGCIAIDPENPSIVWVGTGENNNQRSVSYGDGVYKSEDGGRTWRNVGLKHTEHIARIVVDPRDSNVVYVAAPGPLWKGGGERGLYKTTDGGKTWSQSLIKVGEYTGCRDVIMDPRNPDILLAATHQRQRRYFGMIHGGPESALWRSIDAGKTWTKVRGGFPHAATWAASASTTRPPIPASFTRRWKAPEGRGGTLPLHRQRRHLGAAQQLRFAGPILRQGAGGPGQLRPHLRHEREHHGVGRWRPHHDRAAAPATNTWTITISGSTRKNNNHYLVAATAASTKASTAPPRGSSKRTCPPPSCTTSPSAKTRPSITSTAARRTTTASAARPAPRTRVLTNADCFVTMGGDGFYSRVDPKDPNTIYATMQNGGMVRFDKRTGERVSIQPQPAKGDPAMRWNWDAPLIISPHSNTRLYFGAQRLYRSDDRGDSWQAVSPDLTRATGPQ